MSIEVRYVCASGEDYIQTDAAECCGRPCVSLTINSYGGNVIGEELGNVLLPLETAKAFAEDVLRLAGAQ